MKKTIALLALALSLSLSACAYNDHRRQATEYVYVMGYGSWAVVCNRTDVDKTGNTETSKADATMEAKAGGLPL